MPVNICLDCGCTLKPGENWVFGPLRVCDRCRHIMSKKLVVWCHSWMPDWCEYCGHLDYKHYRKCERLKKEKSK